MNHLELYESDTGSVNKIDVVKRVGEIARSMYPHKENKMLSTPNIFTIKIISGNIVEEIEWPIVKVTAKALLVTTPGGEIWLPRHKFTLRKYSANRVDELIRLISRLSSTSKNAIVRIWKAGAGPTKKSHKFKVAVIQTEIDCNGEQHRKLLRRCFTLPISQIQIHQEHWHAPVWLFMTLLGSNEQLSRPHWPGLIKVTNQINQIAERVMLKQREADAINEAIKQKRIQNQIDQKTEYDRLSKLVVNEGALSLVYCKKHFNLEEMRQAGIELYFWPKWPPVLQQPDLKTLEKIFIHAKSQPNFESWKKRNAAKCLTS